MLRIHDDRQMRALTGLSLAQFEKLLETFTQVYHEQRQATYEQGVAAGTRQRCLGGGAKGKLPTLRDKLLLPLYYYKVYPTFDVLGTQFELARSKACENLAKWSPVLYAALGRLGLMPYREFKTPAELKAALQGVDTVIVDATERACQRAQDDATQREHYSGKKKRHTFKNTVLSRPDKFIVFLGRTFSGHNHDYTMLKTELPPDQDWFAELRVLVDLGYLGIRTDYTGDHIEIPTRKPRKSQQNPAPPTHRSAKSGQSGAQPAPHFCGTRDWRPQTLQYPGPALS